MAFVGDKITYACYFKYQGRLMPYGGNVIWRDSTGVKLKQEGHFIESQVPVPFSKPGTCYTGESTVRKVHAFYLSFTELI